MAIEASPKLVVPVEMETKLKQQFDRFHAANPQVWQLFLQFTDQLIQAGRSNYSADMVMHRIRWETSVKTDSGYDKFKLNNNYSAYYARLFHQEFPEHAGFFRVRRIKGE